MLHVNDILQFRWAKSKIVNYRRLESYHLISNMAHAQITYFLKKNYWCASIEIGRMAVERVSPILKINANGNFSWDGSDFVLEPNQSQYGHSYTMLGNYKGSPFIVGDSLLQHTRVEVMDVQTKTWTELESYPFAREWAHNKNFQPCYMARLPFFIISASTYMQRSLTTKVFSFLVDIVNMMAACKVQSQNMTANGQKLVI